MAEKILVVDDDLDTVRLVGLMLERQGFEILAANNGHQAIVMARSENPSLILLDLMMPDIDGIEVARQLRAETETQDIPIIMFTAKTRLEDKLMGYEAGADDYITKPIQPRELFAHVKAVLGRAHKVQAAPPVAVSSDRGYMLGVTGIRGGMGASTLVINLGVALVQRTRKSVIVADFRPGFGSIGMDLGYLQSQGLNRLLGHEASEIDAAAVDKELVTHSSKVRLLLASPQPQDARHINDVEHFEAIAKHLAFMADYIVLDTGPSLTPVNVEILPMCDEVILLLEPSPPGISQTKLYMDALIDLGIAEGRITVVLYNRSRSGMQLSFSQVQEQFGHNIPVIFTPVPELAYQAAINNVPMMIQQMDGIRTQQFVKLAERVAQRSG